MSENKNTMPAVAIPLPKNKKMAVQTGCIFLMMSIAMFGLSLSVLQGPILKKMDAMNYFSLLTIASSLGLSIMTPIGGKLGDLFGRRNVVIVSSAVASICGIGMCIVQTATPFIILRLLLGAAQGAFMAAPYIITQEINERKNLPKAMGILASSVSIGGFVGSIIAGAFADANLLGLAIAFPVIPLIIGTLLVWFNMPNKKREIKPVLDITGIIVLTIFVSAFTLSLNFAGKIGWTNIIILGGFALAIISLIVFVKVENKATDPIVPMRLFKNKQYTSLLLVGMLAYFYMGSMNVYAPLAIQQVIGASATVSGTLQLPRTIITMFLPIIAGIWVGKKKDNFWKGMAVSAILIAISFIPLSFTTPETSVALYIVMISITGIAESLRGVTVTAAAQGTLQQQDMGVGTALVNFGNAISGLISASICGVLFDSNINNINQGINLTFMASVISAILGLFIILFFVRKYMKKESMKVQG